MTKLLRFASSSAIVFSLVVLGAGSSPSVAPAQAAVHPGTKAPPGYDLTSLVLFRQVIVRIKDSYVDPKRIEPKDMFFQALVAIEKQVAEVMVDGDGSNGKVKLTVGNASKTVDFSDLHDVWEIPLKMKEVMAFLKDNLTTPPEDPREIEYAAINGMLATLDPHSWLLKPTVYKEMKLQTRGEFGGLGFLIRMRDDRLTVDKVLKNTPAQRGGVKKHDHIVRIEDESTINMDLNDAVSRLRGKPGTPINIWISRGGAEPKQFKLTRDNISIESVVSKLLSNGVGYVKLNSFAGTTTRDLREALRSMKSQNGATLKGLVLDMRGNPGGLFEEAVKVVDLFVKEGTIVTTVDGHEKTPKLAKDDGGELDFPMAVLVNSESASASEIVAGGLKNLNRALIVGRQTFGKGSVQILYDFEDRENNNDSSALKLTVSQYLTPGDVSIQSLGITPDIELLPARVTKNRIDLFAPVKLMREEDLDKHFGLNFTQVAKGEKAEPREKPSESLRYLREDNDKLDAKEKKAEADAASDDQQAEEEDENVDEDVVEDYQVKFCRDLVLRAPAVVRQDQLAQARPFLEERRQSEEAKIHDAIGKLGVNWEPGTPGAVKLTADVRPAKVTAGDTLAFTITTQNAGVATAGRVRAYTTSEDPLFDRREFVFGRIGPGEKKSWTVPIKVPKYLPSRKDDIVVHFEEGQGRAPEDVHTEAEVVELPRPSFAFTWQVQGASTDGLVVKGQPLELVLDVKNVGVGKSNDAYASIRNLADEVKKDPDEGGEHVVVNMFIKKGRVRLGELKPGETKSATFNFTVMDGFDKDKVPLKLEVGDRQLYEIEDDKLMLPVESAPVTSGPSPAEVKVLAEAAIYAGADKGTPKISTAKAGTLLAAKGKVGNFYRVEWTKGRTGYVLADAASAATGKASGKGAEWFALSPPVIKVLSDTSKGAIEVDADRLALSGSASDPDGLRDLRIFVQHERENDARKVFFRTAGGAGAAKQLDFSTDLTLKPGNNTVVIIAREDDDFASQKTFVIHRKGSALVQKGGPAAAHP